MNFTYQVEADFVSAGNLFVRTRRGWGIRRAIAIGLLTLLLAAAAVFLYQRSFALAAIYVALALVYAGLFRLQGWQLRRQFRKIPALHDPRTLQADERQVSITSPLTEGRFDWQVLDRFAENEQAFILVQQGGRIFFPISKRQLTPAQVAEFRALCAASIRHK